MGFRPHAPLFSSYCSFLPCKDPSALGFSLYPSNRFSDLDSDLPPRSSPVPPSSDLSAVGKRRRSLLPSSRQSKRGSFRSFVYLPPICQLRSDTPTSLVLFLSPSLPVLPFPCICPLHAPQAVFCSPSSPSSLTSGSASYLAAPSLGTLISKPYSSAAKPPLDRGFCLPDTSTHSSRATQSLSTITAPLISVPPPLPPVLCPLLISGLH